MSYPHSRNYFISERRERKLRLLNFIADITSQKGGDGVSLSRLLGYFSMLWGLRTSKILEYIDELKLAGLITINSDRVRITDEGLKYCKRFYPEPSERSV